MDFESIIKSGKDKKLLLDIVLYISISILVSAILLYFIFLVKISSQKNEITKFDKLFLEVGTIEQKEKEAKIFVYQKKINDYAKLLAEHKSSLNVFNFLESQTMPEVWFSRISLSEEDTSIVLSGEAGNMDVLSRQISNFEKNNYVSNIAVLSSSISDSGRIKFNLTLNLKDELFVPNFEDIASE